MKKYPIFRFFSSLKLAVFSILTLASVLTYGTIAESFYGMRGAHNLVYGTWWFLGVLLVLGLNVLCAALSRYPWKRHQTGFVVTHAGILTLLLGSLLTQRYGVDGNLPVVEGGENNEVLLNDLVLAISEEDSDNPSLEIPIPESARARSGNLITLSLGGKDSICLTRFVPRVVMEKRTTVSPLPGAGVPAIELSLFNSRFRVEEWMMATQPEEATELNMGPAVLTFKKLWSKGDETRFFHPPPVPEEAKTKMGKIAVEYRGRVYTGVIESHWKKWKPLPGSGLDLIVDKYLPYAVVENNQLISKSSEPRNPATQIRLRTAQGAEEKHTVFALFPEFTTLHRAHGGGDVHLSVKIRMAAAGEQDELMGVGKKRGRLELAQSVDSKKLFYRALSPTGKVNGEGEVQINKTMDTGWMDLRFEVKSWFPYAIQEEIPREVDKIEAGGESNFLSAIYLEPGGWIVEGDAKLISVGGKKITARLQKSRDFLPFPIFLKKFTVGNDPGTTKAASYESEVTVKDAGQGIEKSQKISMNEPLEHGGFTFYQASYQLREDRPPISVFAVNRDPGRWVKYLGSLLIVLGAALMFYMNPHYWDIVLGRKRT